MRPTASRRTRTRGSCPSSGSSRPCRWASARSTRSTRRRRTSTSPTAASRMSSDQHVWAFLGDGEMDEVESRGALQCAANEGLDNLTFVINCQPAAPRRPGARQRQDHPGARELLPRRRLERHQGRLGPRVGRAARPRHRRRARQPDEPHARRRLPDLQGRERRLRARELLRPRPARAEARQGLHRRPALEPQARRPRLPQGVRGVQGGRRAQGPAHRHHREDDQGLRPRAAVRGPQRDPPDEEADARQPQAVPRRRCTSRSRTPCSRRTRTCRRTTTRARTTRRSSTCRSAAARSAATCRSAARSTRRSTLPDDARLRDREEGLRQAGDRHDDGVRPPAQGPAAREGLRPPHRADHPG